MPDSTRLVLGFTWRFLAIVALLSTLVYIDEAALDGAAIRILTSNVATWVCWTVNLFGMEAHTEGNQIILQTNVFKIIEECVGLEVMELYAAAILAFPVSWSARFRGLATGIPILFSINFVRMVSLVFLGVRSDRALEIGHLYVWPLIVIAVAIGMWLSWAWNINDETSPTT